VRYSPQSRLLELEIDAEEGVKYTTQFIGTPTDYDTASHPAVATDGKPLRATRVYSDDVGKVLATVEGAIASYQLTGGELYARAVVTSSRPHRDPSFEGQRQQAWTQPVGWEHALQASKRVKSTPGQDLEADAFAD
jgi:hypothetical protein